MKKILFIVVLTLSLQACTSTKVYENESFPDESASWLPVNPEFFSLTEAQRIFEGSKIK